MELLLWSEGYLFSFYQLQKDTKKPFGIDSGGRTEEGGVQMDGEEPGRENAK